MAWSYIVGYGFSLIVGHWLVRANVDALWEGLGVLKNDRTPWHPAFLGLLERAMYTASVGAGQPGFIAVWLGLKAVPQWKRWSEDVEAGERKIQGRAVFNIFLIGNALSVLFAVLGAQSIEWLNDGEVARTIVVCLLVVSGTITSWIRSTLGRKSRI